MAKVTYLGHSCFIIETAGKKLLTDPFIRPNILAKNIDFKQIEADYILVSHGHEDHTADLIDLAKQTGAKVVCNFEIHLWLNKQGIENTHPMNLGGNWPFEFGNVQWVNAVHSSMLPDGSYGGAAAGFVVQNDEETIYFAGDTALTMDMKLLKDRYNIDLAFLPIGDNFTMDMDDAVRAADFCGAKKVIGMHYDTFGYIKIDHNLAVEAFAAKRMELFLLNIGQTLELNS